MKTREREPRGKAQPLIKMTRMVTFLSLKGRNYKKISMKSNMRIVSHLLMKVCFSYNSPKEKHQSSELVTFKIAEMLKQDNQCRYKEM